MVKHVVITGASSGIGQALAEALAKPNVTLSLTGRNAARLRSVADTCRAKGATVQEGLVDVTEPDALADWLLARDDDTPVTHIIANAGISGGTHGLFQGEDEAQIKALFDVNFYGVLNTIMPLKSRMIARGAGQIVIMSSLAGYRGWAGAPAYCASKAAIRVYGEALRTALAPHNVKVTVVCPGFIRSRMTDANDFPMPFLMDTDKAARLILKKLAKNPAHIAFPWPMVWALRVLNALPEPFLRPLLQNAPAKSSL